MAIFGTGTPAVYNCQLTVNSTILLALVPKGGCSIFIDGSHYLLLDSAAAATAVISNAGLTAATLYFVYAYWDGSAVKLEISTTAFSPLGTYGQYIKIGDNSRTYVGIIYTGPGTPGTFVDSETQRFCASFYNRINKPVQRTALTGTPSTTSATFVEMTAADKVEFICFGEESSNCYYSGCGLNATIGNIVGGGIGVNGTGVILAPNLLNQPNPALGAIPISGNVGYLFSPQLNYINFVGKSSGGTSCTFAGANCGFGAMLRQ